KDAPTGRELLTEKELAPIMEGYKPLILIMGISLFPLKEFTRFKSKFIMTFLQVPYFYPVNLLRMLKNSLLLDLSILIV
ncbi:MAG: hypothetical protein C6Y22_05140, partial [Hapalosiphonaceae cyanobacterium JJU2]